MTPERWAKVVSIFEEAAARTGEARVAFLDSIDSDLRSEVVSLLAHADGDDRDPADSAIAAAAAAALAPTRLGHFRIAAQIGRGGMGVVYRAIDDRLGRAVALKVLPDEVAAQGERRRRFLREAKVAATVNHPNIATVYEVGESDGKLFIAMELVVGRTLRAILAEGRLGEPEAIAIAKQVLAALSVAHDAGITHRDLKPDNVMIANGTVKVLDFGLAKYEAAQPTIEAETLTQAVPGHIRGTPSYMSPEQARGEDVDRRSDVFSFGVMFYEMVAGARPFAGASTADLVSSILRDEPLPPSGAAPHVAAVIARCLAKDPAKRYQSCTQIAADLDSAGVAPRPRRRIAIAVASTSVALLAAGAVVVAMTGDDAPSAPTPVVTSANPRAARAYADGMQAYRDGRYDDAIQSFGKATEHDPDLAVAYLRTALSLKTFPERARPSFRKALALRKSLDARDQGLLDAMEPWFLRQPADAKEAARRLSALARRFPEDAEIALFHVSVDKGSIEDEIAKLEHVLALDPKLAHGWHMLAELRAYRGDFAPALADLERCLAEVPNATTCLRQRFFLSSALGDCAQIETDARRWLAIEPDSPEPSFRLAHALAARGSSTEAVAESIRKSETTKPEYQHPVFTRLRAQAHQALAILEGDFASAIAQGEQILATAETSSLEVEHAAATRAQAALLVELGDLAGAARLATAFLERRQAWEADPRASDWAMQDDPTAVLLAIQRRAGTITPARAASERAAQLAAWERRIDSGSREFLWIAYYAAAVETPEEAAEAVAVMDTYGEAPAYAPDPHSEVDGAIGRTLFLGGRTDAALPFLERAAKACYVLRFPIEHIRTSYFLAEAKAAKGDRAGACAGFRVVLDRWDNAKPRSITAERARKRAAALGC